MQRLVFSHASLARQPHAITMLPWRRDLRFYESLGAAKRCRYEYRTDCSSLFTYAAR